MRTLVLHLRPPSEGAGLVVAEVTKADDPAKAAAEIRERYIRVNWPQYAAVADTAKVPIADADLAPGHEVLIVTTVRESPKAVASK